MSAIRRFLSPGTVKRKGENLRGVQRRHPAERQKTRCSDTEHRLMLTYGLIFVGCRVGTELQVFVVAPYRLSVRPERKGHKLQLDRWGNHKAVMLVFRCFRAHCPITAIGESHRRGGPAPEVFQQNSVKIWSMLSTLVTGFTCQLFWSNTAA